MGETTLRRADTRLQLNDTKYKPQLDGLRAVAVLVVLAYHAHLPFTSGGYVGVDVFFVLSGYLITTILLRETDLTGRIRLGAFYAKRALRLFPALVVVCIFVGAAWLLLPWAPVREDTLWGVPAAITYLSSWVRAFDINSLGYIGHTWSLAVEEHFYLVWPLLLLALMKISRRPRAAIVVVAVLAVAYRLLAPTVFGWHLDRIYNGSDTQAAQLLIGCALAALLPQIRRVNVWVVVLAGIVLGAAVVLMPLESPTYLYGGSVMVGLASAALIGHIVTADKQWMARLLQQRALVWVGKRSYGIYLWHYPIFGLLSASVLPFPVAVALSVAFSFIIPALSFTYLEKPFLRMKERLQPRSAHDAGRDELRPEVVDQRLS